MCTARTRRNSLETLEGRAARRVSSQDRRINLQPAQRASGHVPPPPWRYTVARRATPPVRQLPVSSWDPSGTPLAQGTGMTNKTKTKSTKRKFQLSKETFRRLSDQSLNKVAGGATVRMTPPICSDACCD
jgi:hypothetical protein